MFKLRKLEDRIVLDGALMSDVHDHQNATMEWHDMHDMQFDPFHDALVDAVDSSEPLYIADPDTGADAEGLHVLVISSDVVEADDLAAAANDNVIVIQYDAVSTSLEELSGNILDALDGRTADSIAFASHNSGNVMLHITRTDIMTQESLVVDEAQIAFWAVIGEALADDGRIDLLGCNIATEDAGKAFLAQLEDLSGAEVAASTDLTGNESLGGDWILEHGNVDVKDVYFTDAIDKFDELLLPPTINLGFPGVRWGNVGVNFGYSIETYDPNAFSDPEGQDMAYYLKGGVPNWMSGWTSDTGTFAGIPTADNAGTSIISIQAWDRNSPTGPIAPLTIAINRPPQAAIPIPSASAVEDALFTWTMPASAFTDADGHTLRYYVLSAPSWMQSWNSTTGTMTGTPGQAQVGTNVLQIQAWDQITPYNGIGAAVGAVTTFILDVTPTNDAPILADGGTMTLAYTEGTGPQPLASAITVTDEDSTMIQGATVRISANFVPTEDSLSFTSTTNISGGWNISTGALVLTGNATLAEYQAALQSVSYSNSSGTPNTTARTVDITVRDIDASGTNHLTSAPLSYTINVTPVASAPVMTAGGTLPFTEGQVATAIDNTITVTDAENDPVTSATVTISSGYSSGNDVLSYAGALTPAWDAVTGTLTLTGSNTPAIYQTALRAVTFNNTNENPSTTPRVVTWVVNDGTANSNSVTSTINLTAVNDAPVMTGGGTTLAFTEGDSPTIIDNTIALTDVDNTNLARATVSITANLVPGEDVLNFPSTTTITSVWDPALGLLQLTGNATLQEFQDALRSVTYMNTSNNPSTLARTVTFMVNDGAANSNVITNTINLTPVNDAPIVTAGNTNSFTEGEPAKILDSTLQLSDSDEPGGGWVAGNHVTFQITPATIQANDILSFAGMGGISGAWDGVAGTLTLSGAATVAAYQTAIQNVRFENTSNDPVGGTREITIIANDGEALNNLSAAASAYITVVPVNDVPVLAGGGVELAYTEGQIPTAIGGGFTITDGDDTTIQQAMVTIGAYVPPGDLDHVLSFTGTATITGAFNTVTGVMTLIGEDTLANYQTALNTIMYNNLNLLNPVAETLTLTYQVSDGTAWSNMLSNTVRITAVNSIPEVTVGGPLNYTENQGAVTFDNTITVTDADSPNLQSASITITGFNGIASGDLLTFTNTANITSMWNSFSHMLTLTGNATQAEWQDALRSVSYQNTSENPSAAARTVNVMVNDGTAASVVATKTINITPVNDPSVVTAGTAVTYLENDGATAMDVDPGNIITVTDVDNTNLVSATVRIAGGTYQASEDVLAAPGAVGGIVATWNAASGILSLSGSATLAAYQTALQSVTYANTNSSNPFEGARTLRFTVSDGTDFSNFSDSTVTVQRVNDAPILTAGGVLNYTEGQLPTPIDNGILVYDVDSTAFDTATVSITGGFLAAEDRLSFAASGNINGSYNAGTGVMTLTGSDTLVNWRSALRAVSYDNLGGANPTVQQRVITYSLSDGTSFSVPVTSTVNIIAVNTAPVVTSGAATVYVEDALPVALDTNVTVTDVDDTMLNGANVRITSGTFQPAQDVLAFAGFGTITSGGFAGGVLTLNGIATVADYQTALRMITYNNTNTVNPVTGIREIRWVANDGTDNSLEGVSTIQVNAVNDVPVMTAPTSDQTYNEEAPPVLVDPDVSVTIADPDDTNMVSARVQITGGYQAAEDVLAFPGAINIIGTWDSGTGTMNLLGNASISEYQAAIRSVTYVNTTTAADPIVGPRTITYTVNDGDIDSAPVTNIVNVLASNNPPIITLSGATVNYTENDPATVIDPVITIADSDSTTMVGATISLGATGSAGDRLRFTPIGTIASAWDPGTYTLILTGTTTIANWQTALSSVTYENTGDNPAVTQRTVTYILNDGGTANNLSDPMTTTVNVTAVNDLPTVTSSTGGAATWTETGAAAVTIDTNTSMTAVDPDNASIMGYAQFSAATFQSGQDVLQVGAGSIVGTWDPLIGRITFTGTPTEIQTAFRALEYDNLAGDASFAGTRVVEFWASDAEGSSTPLALSVVNVVSDVNTAPIMTNSVANLTYTEGSGTVRLDDALAITDADSATLTGATIQITTAYDMLEDRLSFVNTANITGSFNQATGTLTLTGTDTLANYQTALRNNVYYQNLDVQMPTGTTRTVTYIVTDDGGLTGTDTRDIDIAYINNNMHSFTAGGVLNYTEGGAATVIDAGATVTDLDGVAPNATIDTYNLTIRIVSGYEDNSAATYPAEDILACAPAVGTATWNAGTQTLTFSNPLNLTDVNTAIQGTTYISDDGLGGASVNPGAGTRIVEYTIESAVTAGEIASGTSTVNVTAVNSLPVLAGTPGIAAYAKGSGAQIIDATDTFAITDADDDMMEGATVRFSGGTYVNGEDELAFGDGIGSISFGGWNPLTGILTLTGTDTLANYELALQEVTYNNLDAMSPTAGARTIDFTVTDGDDNSNIIAATVTVTNVNVAPTVIAPTMVLNYTEGAAATSIDPSGTIMITDPDSTMISGATVAITGNYQNDLVNGRDILSFTPAAGIGGSFNALTGTLTLTGTASVADYDQALSNVMFRNAGPFPNQALAPAAAPRTLTIIVTDAEGVASLPSAAVTQTVNILPVDTASVVTAGGGVAAFTEAGAAVAIDAAITVTDVDDLNIESAVVWISGGYVQGQDVLGYVGGLGSTWDVTTGTLFLYGTDTLANYQAALAAITYDNPSVNPTTTSRYVSFQVNDGDLDSNVVVTQVTVTPTDVAPVVTPGAALVYVEGDGAVAFDPAITVTDADEMLASVSVQITTNYTPGEDYLALPAVVGNITGLWNPGTGTLTLSGADTPANYTTALQSVTYENVNLAYPTNCQPVDAAPNRDIVITVNDGVTAPVAGAQTIGITADSNNAHTLTVGGSVTYTEGDGLAAVALDGASVVVDADVIDVYNITVQITSGYVDASLSNDPDVDALNFTGFGAYVAGISTTGTLNIAAPAYPGVTPVAEITDVLRNIFFYSDNGAGGESLSPTPGTRGITWTVTNPATSETATGTSTVVVVGNDDAPVLTDSNANVIWTEAAPAAVVLDAGIVITDADSDIASATIAISNYVAGEDELQYTGPYSSVWNPATGVLTLYGPGDDPAFQTELRAVAYQNLNPTNPTAGIRNITWTATDGTTTVTDIGDTVTVVAMNSAPVVVAPLNPLNWTEGAGTTKVDTLDTLTITDAESDNISGATVQIISGLTTGDVLGYTAAGGITGLYNSGTGLLTLTGTTTLANYQTVLRSITFNNTSADPTLQGTAANVTRTLSYFVTDVPGDTSALVPPALINITHVNQMPVLTATTSASPNFTEGGAPVDLDLNNSLTLTDADNVFTLEMIDGAEIRFVGQYIAGNDMLNIPVGAVSIVPATGQWFVTGTDTLANWQTGLQGITYQNNNLDNPVAGQRQIQIRVYDDEVGYSNWVSHYVNVVPVNDAPTVDCSDAVLNYTENAGPVVIDPGVLVADVDSNITSATVRFTPLTYVAGQDVLSFTNAGGITGAWNSATGTLTLTGNTTPANFQAALRTVSYTNTSDAPNIITNPRVVEFRVNDGALTSTGPDLDRSINIIAVNDPPVLTVGGNLNFTEGNPATVLNSALTLTDLDGTALGTYDTGLTGATATVSITAGAGPADTLVGTGNALVGLAGSGTQTITLTGLANATVSDFQAMLRSILFYNGSEVPVGGTRTVTFTVDDDGAGVSAPVSSTMTVQVFPVNDAPVIMNIDPPAGDFTEDMGPVAVSPAFGATIGDVDNPSLYQMTVRISGGYQSGADVLSYTGVALGQSWDPVTGTLTLSGPSLAAEFEAAPSLIAFNNTSQDPDETPRTLSWQVNDGQTANNLSNIWTTTLNVVAVNDAPVVTTTGTPVAYTEGDLATALDAGLVVADVDSDTLVGATVEITGGFELNEDVLALGPQGAISTAWDAANGILYLSGTATVAEYQAALRLVTYQNVDAVDPAAGLRTIEIIVDDGEAINNLSLAVTVEVNVTLLDDAPVVTAGGTLNYTENDPAAIIDGSITVTDADSPNLALARVWIDANYDIGDDVLTYAGALGATWDGVNGILTLSGAATPFDYQQALRSITFVNTSDAPVNLARTIAWMVNDGVNDSAIAYSTINVTAVNDAPTAPFSVFYINENSAASQAVNTQPDMLGANGAVLGTDPDGTITYSLIDASGKFQIDSVSGAITYNGSGALDFETQDVYVVTAVMDDGQTTANSMVVIEVNDLAEAPLRDYTVDQGIADQNQSATGFGFQFAANAFEAPDAGHNVVYEAVLFGGGPLPAWLSFDSANRLFWSTAPAGGTISVEVRAHYYDGSNVWQDTVIDTFNLTVATLDMDLIRALEQLDGEAIENMALPVDGQVIEVQEIMVADMAHTFETQTLDEALAFLDDAAAIAENGVRVDEEIAA